jgi:hypothetical protein
MEERKLMRRRTFLGGAASLALVSAIPLPADDPYGRFLDALRERLIKLVGNGYVVEQLTISPPQDEQRMTYGEFMRKQNEHRREAFSKLSEEEKSVAWNSRCEWHHSELPRLAQHGQRIECCPVCSHVELTAHCWPEVFSCHCGALIVVDRWLPDDRERVLIRFPVRS